MEPIGHCWHCRRPLGAVDYDRENTCLGCGKATRVCRNCKEYQPGRPNDCLEPMAEPVQAKDRATMCEFFQVNANPDGGAQSDADALRRAAEDLFR